jgi:hypothetical protein
MTISLKQTPENAGEQFFRISHILRDLRTGEVLASGQIFVKNKDLKVVGKGLENEVSMVVSSASGRDNEMLYPEHQIRLEQVVGVRQLRFMSRDTDPVALSVGGDTLICRTLVVTTYKSTRKLREKASSHAGVVRPLRIRDGVVYENLVEMNIKQEQTPTRSSNGVYEMTDVCSGLGGASFSAEKAGLKIKAFVENDPERAKVYGLNFPYADAYVQDLQDGPLFFYDHTTDVLHFSVPCKPWSKAHRIPGKNDNLNKDLLFEIPRMINIVKPRQVCIEQVNGLIIWTKNRSYFERLIRQINSLGYAVSWDIFNLVDYGLPAQRRRLIIFASA